MSLVSNINADTSNMSLVQLVSWYWGLQTCMVADGVSMGFGDFVSASTEKEMARKERAATELDVSNSISSQQAELLSTCWKYYIFQQ